MRGQYEASETRGQWVTGYYVMLEGKTVLEGDPSHMTEDAVKKAYFGI